MSFYIFCKLGLHNYGDMTFRPCERFKACKRCGKEKIYSGYHMFEEWSQTYYVKVYYGEEYIGIESNQQRYCKNCRLYDERTLQ